MSERLSLSCFLLLADSQLTDEESPTRLTLFDSHKLMEGLFSAAWRPQEDLSPHLLAAVVNGANRISADYDRTFDLAIMLGDMVDNAQTNETLWALDILDGTGRSSGLQGVCRPDSGALDLDPAE